MLMIALLHNQVHSYQAIGHHHAGADQKIIYHQKENRWET